MSYLADTPAAHDVLDYAAYRDALVSIIDGLDQETSLTISVFGDWGSGKTTLLRMVRDEIKKGKIQSIWVNVWQFGNEEDVWTAFLQSILMKVKRETPWHRRFLFNLGLFRRRIDWDEVKKKIQEIIIRVLVAIFPLAASLLITKTLTTSAGTEKSTTVAGTVLSAVLGWFLLLQPYIQAVRERVKVDLRNLVKSSQIRRRVSLLDQFRTYFEDMILSLVGKKGRLVIFVDDLDRCQPDRIVQVLDAIKLFLDIPGCVYMIGLDRQITEQAIRVKFEGYEGAELQAREYLEKIIGLPFDLPPLSGEQMEILVNSFQTGLPELQEFGQVFALGQEPNPRKVKRTINMFLLLWALAQRRAELRDTIKPIRLAKLVVIQHSHRDFYVVLTSSPSGIGELEAFFRQPKSDDVSSLPEYLKPFASQPSLGRLLTLYPATGNEDANFTQLQDGKHKPLSEDEIRNYIRLARSVTRDKPAIVRTFISRQAEIDAFVKVLSGQDKRKIVVVTGPAGFGKSALLTKYQEICKERGVRVIRLEPTAAGPDPVDFVSQVKAEIALEDLSTSERDNAAEMALVKEKLMELTAGGQVVIVLDNYELVSEPQKEWFIYDLVGWLIDVGPAGLKVVVSGREIPSESRLGFKNSVLSHPDSVLHLELKPFSRADTEEYLRYLGLDLAGQRLNELHEAAKGNPVMLASLAESIKNRVNL